MFARLAIVAAFVGVIAIICTLTARAINKINNPKQKETK